MKGGTWRPAFHRQVAESLSLAVQYLAPICENAGWSADPFDRLLAWGVEDNPAEDKKNIQDACTLIAKLRRRYGLVGGNFYVSSDESAQDPHQDPPRRRRRAAKRRRSAAIKPLTALQQQALELYAKHNGRIKAIAAEMKITHATVSQHLKAAWRKLPGQAPQRMAPRNRVQRLPTDHRGQINS